MKKNVINQIEKEIEQKTKLTDEIKNKLKKNIFENFLLGIVIVTYLLYYVVGSNLVATNLFISICKIFSVITLILSIVLLETSYKRDNGYIAMNALEILALAIITLFIPYTFFERDISQRNYNKMISIYFIIYYWIKGIFIYNYEKKQFMKQESDIKEIIEKKDKDLIKEEKERRKKETQKNKKTTTKNSEKKVVSKTKQNEAEVTKTPKSKDTGKSKAKEKKNDKNTVKENKQETSEPEVKKAPKKRGRPRKEKTEQ